MKARTHFDASLRRLLTVQEGVVSREQAQMAGLNRRILERMLAQELLWRLTPGIYATTPKVNWLGQAWAGLLLGGPEAVLGLEAAGNLHQISAEPTQIPVFTNRRIRDLAEWRFIRAHRAGRDEPARTNLEATVVDLCADADEDALTAMVADVISGRKTTAAKLLAEVDSRRRVRHRRLFQQILGQVAAGAHSAMERRFMLDVEQAHCLPVAKRQRRAGVDHRSDAWYDDYQVVLELDGRTHHLGSRTFNDMLRDNDHALAGILTFRLGWAQVVGSGACTTARFLGSMLMSRGWEGPVMPCSNCELIHPI